MHVDRSAVDTIKVVPSGSEIASRNFVGSGYRRVYTLCRNFCERWLIALYYVSFAEAPLGLKLLTFTYFVV